MNVGAEIPASIAGRYRLERQLGEGARKRVYLARDERLEREVAIALIKTDGLDDAGLVRVRREAQAMARLGDHPAIVTIFDVGDDEDRPFIVMQYMAGGTVEDLLRQAGQRPLPLERTLGISASIAAALEHAHAHGIVHRDLKPGNVWLGSDGSAKLGDFGLAQTSDRSRVTQEGSLVGTVTYMPPEQALGRAVDARSDLYALGVMLYEMATGTPPFRADDLVGLIYQHANVAPELATRRNPDVPAALAELIADLLAKAPDDRPAEAKVVLERLRAIVPSETSDPERERVESAVAQMFVGRDAEMKQLRGALDEAFAGRGKLVVLSGDPGIGKTRTTEALADVARTRGARVLVGRCYEGDGAPAFWPWVQILRDHVEERSIEGLRAELGAGAGEVSQIVPEIRGRLEGVLVPAAAEGEQARFRLFDAVTTFVKSAARARPMVLVLEDLHWADKSSLLLLQFLARAMSGSRLLVIGTYRDGDVRHGHPLAEILPALRRERVFQRIQLRGLAEEDVRAMLGTLSGRDDVPERFVDAIFRDTEGNPFFIEEILRHLVEEGKIFREDGRWTARVSPEEMGLPESVREVIGRRLDRLSEGCRTVLTLAAVCGREFERPVLEHLAAESALDFEAVLAEAAAARVIVESTRTPGRYSFAHALVRETLLEEIRVGDRVALHRRVGEAIETIHAADLDPFLSELAHHFLEAAAGRADDKALEYCERAGAKAYRQLALEEAIAHFGRALAMPAGKAADHAARRTDLRIALADALRVSGEFERARSAYREAIVAARALASPDPLARAAVGISLVGFAVTWFGTIGRVDEELVAVLEEAGERLGPVESALRVRVLTSLARVLYWSDSLERRDRLTGEAVELARRIGDPGELAMALVGRTFAIRGPDSLEERIELSREARPLAERAGATDTILELDVLGAVDEQEAGNREKAERASAAVVAMSRAVPVPELRWYAMLSEVEAPLLAGRSSEAEELAKRAYDFARPVDPRNSFLIYTGQIAAIRFLQGRLPEMEAGIRAIVDEYPGLGAMTLSALGVGLVQAGRDAEARSVFGKLAAARFAGVPRDAEFLFNIGAAAILCAHLDDVPRARELHELLLPFAARNCVIPLTQLTVGSMTTHLGGLMLVLGSFDDAVRHTDEAVRREGEFGNVPWLIQARSLGAVARILRDSPGDRPKALADLEEARDTAARLGIRRFVDEPAYLRMLARVARDAGKVGALREALAKVVAPDLLVAAGFASASPQQSIAAPRPGLATRAANAAREQALRLAAKLVRGRSDETLEKRFGSAAVQMALFNAMAFSFQPEKAFGFAGEIVYELVYPERDGVRHPSDFWTIRIEKGKARAQRGAVEKPAMRIRLSVADLARLVTGELNPVTALLKGLTSVEGDLVVASRLVEMFGGVAAGDSTPAAAATPRSAGGSSAASLEQVLVEARELLARGKPDDRTTVLELLNQVIDGARDIADRELAESAIALRLEIQGLQPTGMEIERSVDAVAAKVSQRRPDLRATAAPDGTVTVMFSDMEGFTEMTERVGDVRAREVIREHNRIIRHELARHHGFEVELLGDGFLVAFSSARRGLECAVAIQRAFEARNRKQPDSPLRVRIGLHTGEVLVNQDKFFGKTVILASRIAGQAQGGEIVVSALMRELLASAGTFAFGVAQEVALKGISGTQRIHAVVWERPA